MPALINAPRYCAGRKCSIVVPVHCYCISLRKGIEVTPLHAYTCCEEEVSASNPSISG